RRTWPPTAWASRPCSIAATQPADWDCTEVPGVKRMEASCSSSASASRHHPDSRRYTRALRKNAFIGEAGSGDAGLLKRERVTREARAEAAGGRRRLRRSGRYSAATGARLCHARAGWRVRADGSSREQLLQRAGRRQRRHGEGRELRRRRGRCEGLVADEGELVEAERGRRDRGVGIRKKVVAAE